MSRSPKTANHEPYETEVTTVEIDLDDMTGEIARTLLACEELAGPAAEGGDDTGDEPSRGGLPSWLI